MEKTWISFVVDKNQKFYYQAELLLHSLLLNSQFDQSTIIVQCIEGVDPVFLSYLDQNNFNHITIPPFLDKKYCNKITQLKYFCNKNINAILLDTDMYITNPITIEHPNVVNAKVVDANRPPLKFINSIYEKAGLSIPGLVPTDWNNTNTCTANFNGGFYYIPASYIDEVSAAWSENATWLSANKHLFGEKKYAIHIDQIAMSLAINQNSIPIHLMDSNSNYPIHRDTPCRYFNKSKKISILHYHARLDNFGLISSENVSEPKVVKAIENANDQIMGLDSVFNKAFRENSILDKFVNFIKKKKSKPKRKLIIHGGTSKTGTTSLQFHLHQNYDRLALNNYIYSKDISKNTYSPKHQWLVDYLLAERFDLIIERIENLFLDMEEEDTLILSTEGIHNHWFDYSLDIKKALHKFMQNYEVTFIFALRDPQSYMRSLHKQYIENKYHKKYYYGRTGDINKAFRNKWFRQHLNYLNFLLEIEAIFGKENVTVIKYSKEIIKQFYGILGIDLSSVQEVKSKNISLSNRDIRSVMFINKMRLKPKSRAIVFAILQKKNRLISKYAGKKKNEIIDPKICGFLENETKYLRKKYHITFD